jgi:hypothetical protein
MENQQNADGCKNQTKGKMISSEARRPLGWIAKAEKCFKVFFHSSVFCLFHLNAFIMFVKMLLHSSNY